MDSIPLQQTIAFLLDAPMFCDLDASELAAVVHILEIRTLSAGEMVFEEGDPGDAWYVVFEGELEVRKAIGSREHVLAVLETGSCFGEMAILDGSPRSAAVAALTPATLLGFPREAFNHLLSSDTLAAFKLVHQISLVLVARQRQTTARLVQLLIQEDPSTLREGLHPIVQRSAVAE